MKIKFTYDNVFGMLVLLAVIIWTAAATLTVIKKDSPLSKSVAAGDWDLFGCDRQHIEAE